MAYMSSLLFTLHMKSNLQMFIFLHFPTTAHIGQISKFLSDFQCNELKTPAMSLISKHAQQKLVTHVSASVSKINNTSDNLDNIHVLYSCYYFNHFFRNTSVVNAKTLVCASCAIWWSMTPEVSDRTTWAASAYMETYKHHTEWRQIKSLLK